MVKPELERKGISSDALQKLISLYGYVNVDPADVEVTTLSGGFSGTSYRVEISGGDAKELFCLKICHGYSRWSVESQARIQEHLNLSGLKKACFALRLTKRDMDDFRFAAVDPDTGDPCLALNYLEGKAADAVIESGVVPEAVVFEQIGMALAEMHAVGLGDCPLRNFRTAGACDVQKQIDHTLYHKMEDSEHTKNHPFFTDFYPSRLQNLKKGMARSADLPKGVIHGDPFLDNALVDPQTGQFCGFVDFEDSTTGPLLFDVACCVIGTCFPEGSSVLNLTRLRNLLRGYFTIRPLQSSERGLFVEFCQLTLLCNTTWRFINFHIDHREFVDCRDKYRDLQDRIVALDDNETIMAIEKILNESC